MIRDDPQELDPLEFIEGATDTEGWE